MLLAALFASLLWAGGDGTFTAVTLEYGTDAPRYIPAVPPTTPAAHATTTPIPILYVAQPAQFNGTGGVTVCIIPDDTSACVAGFDTRHSGWGCAATTDDCRCYDWLAETTGTRCVDVFYDVNGMMWLPAGHSQKTSQITLNYHLLPTKDYPAVPGWLMGYYMEHVQPDYPQWSLLDYANVTCRQLEPSASLPAPCTVQVSFGVHVMSRLSDDTRAAVERSVNLGCMLGLAPGLAVVVVGLVLLSSRSLARSSR
jgi:hypothetical protein